MTPNPIRTGLAGAALLTAVALGGCASEHDMSGMPGMSSAPSASASGASSATASANSADIMFAQMMIPHHQQAVAMSDLIVKKSGVNPEVTALAKQIKGAQQPEIDTMTGWLTQRGSSPMPSGMHHDMGGGMMSEDDMRKLEQADAATGQKMFLEGMIKHHQGAISMAQDEVKNGQNADAVQLARSIVDSQQKEITTMQGLLAKL